MPKKFDPALLEQMYSRMSLAQLQELRSNLVDQLAAIDRILADRSPEVSSDEG